METPSKSRKRIGINDVAQDAGVSVTTVSHALNGKGRIDASTVERVKEAAARLGYRANPAASNLRGGRSGLIGIAYSSSEMSVALTDLAHFVSLFSRASVAALGLGYSLVLTSASVEALERIPLEGMILIDPIQNDPILNYLKNKKIPVVTVGRDPSASMENSYWVDNDLVANTHEMLDHLHSKGARRIALLSPPPIYSYSQDIIASYLSWVKLHHLPILIEETRGGFTESAGYEAAERLFQQPELPDAVHCAVDKFASGVLLSAAIRNISVPEQLLVSAGTDSEIARHTSPALTTLDLNPEETGQQAIGLLIAILRNEQRAPNVHIKAHLIPRASTQR